MQRPGRILAGKLGRIGNVLSPTGMHRHAAVVGQSAMPAFPGSEIVACHQIVRVLYRACGDIDDSEWGDKCVGGNLFGSDAVLRKVNWRVEMRAGMLDQAPAIDIVTVLLELSDPLHLNAWAAIEGRKSGRHHMGEVDDGFEFARCRCACSWRGSSDEPGNCAPPEETAPRERIMLHGFLAAGNAHGTS